MSSEQFSGQITERNHNLTNTHLPQINRSNNSTINTQRGTMYQVHSRNQTMPFQRGGSSSINKSIIDKQDAKRQESNTQFGPFSPKNDRQNLTIDLGYLNTEKSRQHPCLSGRTEIPMNDIINSKIHKNEFGIEGYDIPKFNAHLDKPRYIRIVNSKKTCFIDDFVKSKRFIPSAQYEVSQDLISPKRKSPLARGERITLPVEIEKYEKKNMKPGPGAYEPQIKRRLLGAFNLKDEKSSFIEEAQYQSMQSPSAKYDTKYDIVTPSQPYPKIIASKQKPEDMAKFKKDDLPSPGSYNADISYKTTQLSRPRFYISKSKIISMVDEITKSKKYMPGFKYDINKSYDKISKGPGKSWK